MNGTIHSALKGHTDSVWGVSFSQDGQIIATASGDRTVRLWSLDGKQLAVLPGNEAFTDVSFSSKEDLLIASNDDGTILLWDFDLNSLLEQACAWISDYLTNNSTVSESNRSLCSGVNYSSTTLLEQGKKLARRSSLEEAIAKFQDALKLDSSLRFEPKVYAEQLEKATKLVSEGIDLALKNEVQKATNTFQEALKLDSDLAFNSEMKAKRLAVSFIVGEGENLAKNGHIQEAIAKFKEASELDGQLEINPEKRAYDFVIQSLMDKGMNLAKAEKFDAAIATYLEVKNLFQSLGKKGEDFFDSSKKIEVWYKLGNLFLLTNQLQEAKSYFLDLLKFANENFLYLFSLEAQFREIDTIFFYIGLIAEMEKEPTNVLLWYKKVEKGEKYLDGQKGIVEILAQQGQVNESLEYLHGVSTEKEDEKAKLVQMEIDILNWQKRYSESVVICNESLKIYSDNTDLLRMCAVSEEKTGNLERFEQYLRHILKIEPANVNVFNSLGYTLAERTNRYQEAHDLLKQAMELEPENPFVLDSMGWTLYKMGKYPESLDYLRKAQAKIDASIPPESAAETVAHLGEVLWVSDKKEEAKTVWKKALKDFPDNQSLREVVKKFWPDFEWD